VNTYYAVIEHESDSWGAYVPELPGIAVVADTREEVLEMTREAIELYIETTRELGGSISSTTQVERIAVGV
jgi:predicted RNase H-like HicB family nuclease